MSRLVRAFVVVVLVAVVTAPVAGSATVTGDSPTGTATDSGSIVTPGDRLQGIVGVQEAELGGDIEERSFRLAFNDSETNASKAALVDTQVATLADRLGRLENRSDEFRAARDDGTLTESEFRARMAILAAEARTTRRLANETADATGRLPEAALVDEGVDPESVRSLGRRASNLTDREIAGIARSIAGNSVGRRIAGEKRANVTGPPPDVPGVGTGHTPPGRDNDTDVPGKDATERPDIRVDRTVDRISLHRTRRISIRTSVDPYRARGTDRRTPTRAPGPVMPVFRTPAPVSRAPAPVFRTPAVLAATDTSEDTPLFTVGLRSTEPALVTLRLTFDLESDTDRQGFETLREDQEARDDVTNRFQSRMQSVADNTGPRVDREMNVSDAEIELNTINTTDGGSTGIVTLSVVWSELAGRVGDDLRPNLVITEPFASGFTPSREFTVRVLAPEDYRLTRVAPDPARRTEASASWAAGTSLDDFLLEFTPENGTPLPATAIEGFAPVSPNDPSSTGDGPSTATLAVGGLLAIAVAIGGFLAWRRRETG